MDKDAILTRLQGAATTPIIIGGGDDRPYSIQLPQKLRSPRTEDELYVQLWW